MRNRHVRLLGMQDHPKKCDCWKCSRDKNDKRIRVYRFLSYALLTAASIGILILAVHQLAFNKLPVIP